MKNQEVKFLWRVTASHTIAYFIAGCFAMYVFNYKELLESNTMALFMKPITAPIVALGPALQIIRGLIVALILLPLRKVFTEEKYGFLKLGLLILGLSVFFTFAAAAGSFEGFIYTTISFLEQIIGYPEAILWLSLFIGILWLFYRFEKKIIDILAIIIMILIILMGIAGYFATQSTL
ncbi:MAG: hypothetical protein LBC89_01070 [Bacteroidales bacterium]|jgi:hypothetical protein|nr:hypothetical protein [Bacteroidales bacterium]